MNTYKYRVRGRGCVWHVEVLHVVCRQFGLPIKLYPTSFQISAASRMHTSLEKESHVQIY